MKRIVREVGSHVFTINTDELGIYEVIEQITFEQAFEEWNSKPIAFFGINNKLSWVYWIIDSENNEFFQTINTRNILDIFSKEQLMIPDAKIFQADSLDDLHLNVIPTLIRMARGE